IAFGFVPIRELQEREDGQYRKAWRKASAVRFAGILLVPSGAIKPISTAFFKRTRFARLPAKHVAEATNARSKPWPMVP
ncbi:MAG: hypothetical protein ABSF26_27880, partial [Thermoguttaceae bacterium]